MMEELLSRGALLERGDAEKRTALNYARAMGAHRAAERLAALQQTLA
jgi:uncharacterized protein